MFFFFSLEMAYHDVGQAGFEPTIFLPQLPEHCFRTTVPAARFFCNSSVYVCEPICVFIVTHPQKHVLDLSTDFGHKLLEPEGEAGAAVGV